MDMTKGCWKDRSDYEWPNPSVNGKTAAMLIKFLGNFEKKFLDQLHEIFMEDDEFEAKELGQTVGLLEGLIYNHDESIEEVKALQKKVSTKTKGMYKEMNIVSITRTSVALSATMF